MSRVLANAQCDRRRRDGRDLVFQPCGQPGLYEALLYCFGHDATAVRVLCARCVGHMGLVTATCATCRRPAVVIAGLLRLDGVA